MSVIVDTSVWSLALRRKETPDFDPQIIKLTSLLNSNQPIFLLGVIIAEILQGIRNEKTFEAVKDHLNAFQIIELEREDYIESAKLRNLCLNKGITIQTIDAIIATASIKNGIPLLTSDKDFSNIASITSLQLL